MIPNEGFGFSHAAFQSNIPGYADRHPNRDHIPPINTDRLNTNMMPSELQTPATGLDMNFTPLLPSNLLIGSPLQPTSPMDFATPQFQSFGTISGRPTQQQQQQQQQMRQEIQSRQQEFQSQEIMNPPQIYHQMMTPDLSQSPFLNATTPPMPYGPFAAVAAAAAAAQPFAMMQQVPMQQSVISAQYRTVYLGNIPPDTSAEEVLGHVRSGPIESVRLLADKHCAFISFLDGSSATHFHSDAILKKLCIKGQDVKIGWGKPSAVPTTVALAVQQSGASRNVYLGNIPEDSTEAGLREELGKFGPIDTVKIVKEKAIGFVHFLSIGNAVKAVNQLPQTPKWQSPRRVYYGKDRCAYVSKTQQQNAAQYLGIAPGFAHVLNGADRDLISNALTQQSMAAAAVATTAGGSLNVGNRTVYLGNIHPETTIEEICNVVRGGLLHHIRYIPDKHICFVTFIDPTSAASFFALSNLQGLVIHNRRLKIGWGKHSGALPPAISMAVAGGASRNVYIGNLDESWTEDRLRQDFQEYGETELVNTLREKSCAFVNFTNIANAITAIEGIRSKDEYKRFKVNFGKDRCGNPPRHYAPNPTHQTTQSVAQASESNPSPDLNARTSTPGPGNSQGPAILKPGETGNPLTMYLAAAAQQGNQFSDNISLASVTTGQDGLEQGFYNSDKLGGLEVPQFGHQSTRSVNNLGGGGFSGLPLHKRHLSVGVMNPAHVRTNSLPAFTQPVAQQAFLNAQNANGFGGLAGLANLSLGQQDKPVNGHNPFGIALQDNGLPGWAEE